MVDQVSNKHFENLLECFGKLTVRSSDFDELKEFLNNHYETPEILIRGVEKQNESIVKLLLGQQLDINYQDYKGNTALHYAAQLDSNDILNLLLENGADANILNCEELTALQMAVLSGKVQNYETLAKVTSDQYRKCKSNKTLLHLAVIGGNHQLIEKFSKNVEMLILKDNICETPLSWAITILKNEEISKFLLTKVLDCGFQSIINDDIVDTVLRFGWVDHYILLRKYARIIPEDKLYVVIWSGNVELFKIVLNEDFTYYNTELNHYKIFKNIIREGNYDMCKYLIEAGFNIHATDRYNNTPLHYSAENGRGDIFDLLVKQGANPNALNNESKTPNL